MYKVATNAGADFIKTSMGFGSNIEDKELKYMNYRVN